MRSSRMSEELSSRTAVRAPVPAATGAVQGMKLGLRPLLLLAVLVLGFAVGMACLLNYFKFESMVKKLQRSRIELVADDVRKSMEASLALGAPLEESSTLSDLIGRASLADPLIGAVDILGAQGHTLHSTDSAHRGAPLPPAWADVAHRAGARQWFVTENTAFVTGLNVTNSFDIRMGSVVIGYQRSGFDRTVTAMGRYLGEVGLAVVAGATLLSGLAMLWLLAGIRREFAAAAELLSGDSPAPVPGGAALEREVFAFRSSAAAAADAIAGVGRSLAGEAAPGGGAR